MSKRLDKQYINRLIFNHHHERHAKVSLSGHFSFVARTFPDVPHSFAH